jgi:hypothetical protein
MYTYIKPIMILANEKLFSMGDSITDFSFGKLDIENYLSVLSIILVGLTNKLYIFTPI